MSSLIDAVARRWSPAAAATARVIAAAATLGLLGVAAVDRQRAAALERQAARLEADGGGSTSALAAARAAVAFGRPTLAATLARLANHLPPGAALAEAEQGAAGRVRIALDTDDPAALRAAFRADTWLAGWRERAEEQRDGGRFRVTFERKPAG